MIMMRTNHVLYAICLLLLVVGCEPLSEVQSGPVPTQAPGPATLFLDPTCVIGCWRGLYPGITTIEEPSVQELLAQGRQRTTRSNLYTKFEVPGGGSLTFRNGQLASVATGLQAASLQSVIDHLGPPEYADIFAYVNFPYFILGVVKLYYPSAGVYIEAMGASGVVANEVGEQGAEVCVDPDDWVGRATITVPGTLESLAKAVQHPDSDENADVDVEQLVRWRGFGCYPVPKP
ncbi:MAG: hypothetical protein IPK19_18140 [Chloroflexi bacterium]|nr:hypothetical protein [Chloroflexota bacterium]